MLSHKSMADLATMEVVIMEVVIMEVDVHGIDLRHIVGAAVEVVAAEIAIHE